MRKYRQRTDDDVVAPVGDVRHREGDVAVPDEEAGRERVVCNAPSVRTVPTPTT